MTNLHELCARSIERGNDSAHVVLIEAVAIGVRAIPKRDIAKVALELRKNS